MFFIFNDTATTEIYTLSLHDALPDLAHHLPDHRHRPRDAARMAALHAVDAGAGVHRVPGGPVVPAEPGPRRRARRADHPRRDRKSTRLNSSHANISYAVFCLKKKKHT